MAKRDPEPRGRSLDDGTELLGPLGRGRFARVFAGRAPSGERVAVKLLYRKDLQARRRFQREIKVMRELPSHPGCVAYRAHGALPDGTPWVAMELVDGFALSAVTGSTERLPKDTACALLAQICDGFQGLHALGLTHRDITPDNILITRRDRQVKIIDFGLVQDSQGLLSLFERQDILEGDDFRDDLDAGLIAGTPEYMAPEQISDPRLGDRHARRTDTTADVFALGVILYQLLTGAQLFPYLEGGGARGLLRYFERRLSFGDDDLVAPEWIDAELWSVVRKALRRDPRQRQGTAAELGRDLRYYLETGQGVLDDDLSETTIGAPLDQARLRQGVLTTGEFLTVEALASGERSALEDAATANLDEGAPLDEVDTLLDAPPPPDALLTQRPTAPQGHARPTAQLRPAGRARLALLLAGAGALAALASLVWALTR